MAAEACSIIRFALMSEMKESEKITSYWELLAGDVDRCGRAVLGDMQASHRVR